MFFKKEKVNIERFELFESNVWHIIDKLTKATGQRLDNLEKTTETILDSKVEVFGTIDQNFQAIDERLKTIEKNLHNLRALLINKGIMAVVQKEGEA